MKRLFALTSLFSVLVLASLVEPPAHAAPYCWFMNGRTCSPDGSTTDCIVPGGGPTGVCKCMEGHWSCPI
jgi:hypothetical protein